MPGDLADDGVDANAPSRGGLEELLGLVKQRGYTRSAVPFVLSSGATSYDYVDLRRAVGRGEDLRLAASAVLTHLERLRVEFDAIGGMTMGADPIAHAVALLADKQWFSVRKTGKSHGSRRRIEGAVIDDARVVLFEDTASTGRSFLEAHEVVVAAGAVVVHACTLLDRGEAARRAFEALGVEYSSLLNYRDLEIEPVVVPEGPG